ncbi:MAG: DUF2240 family protein [Thermoplasmatota archaeon]
MSDLVTAVALVFRRKGTARLKKSEFKHAVSFDLNWFAPADAKALLEHAASQGLVAEEGEEVRATFDVASVVAPLDFRPTAAVLEEIASAPRVDLLTEMCDALGVTAQAAREEAARHGDGLTPEVAALVVARRAGADVKPWIGRVAESLKMR